MWSEAFSYLRGESAVLKRAPLAALVLLAVGVSAGALGGLAWRGQEIANLEGVIRLKDGAMDEYRKELNDRLTTVEQTLSAQQVQALKSSLLVNPSHVVGINWISGGGSPVTASQLANAFDEGGWQVQVQTADIPFPMAYSGGNPILVAVPETAEGKTLIDAFDAAGIPYDLATYSGGDGYLAQVWVRALNSTPTPQ